MRKRILFITAGLLLGAALASGQSGRIIRTLTVANTLTFTPFVFANIATAMPTNGMVGYCSDCAIANPCAGSGTGAIAKRLNGVQVCN